MTYEMFMFLIYKYCLKVKRKNGKFTFDGLKVVLSMDGGMGCHSHIAQYCLKVKRKNGKFTFGGLKVVLSMDGGMGCHSHIAQV
ncbi:hypothetical protein MTR67_011827 [Solanum verrucosum]|uniref:Uncharacterized protein n=1 Tax=Solanum verrucosum TaxID=315347 RepID=A0AAF0TFG6_SOLVR|nr:hypothetical protein MTR67_011827 [Solanum verrucosum]